MRKFSFVCWTFLSDFIKNGTRNSRDMVNGDIGDTNIERQTYTDKLTNRQRNYIWILKGKYLEIIGKKFSYKSL